MNSDFPTVPPETPPVPPIVGPTSVPLGAGTQHGGFAPPPSPPDTSGLPGPRQFAVPHQGAMQPPYFNGAPGQQYGVGDRVDQTAIHQSVSGAPIGQVPHHAGPHAPTPSPRQRGVGIKSALIGGLVGAMVAALVTAVVMWDSPAQPVPSGTPVTTEESNNQLQLDRGEGLDIQALLQKVSPSVVSIHIGGRQGNAAGSGIVLNESGLILTNAHVVESARNIEVDFSDGQTASAHLVGAVQENDVALIQAEDLLEAAVPAEIGSSSDLLVGDDLVAIGNALNLGEAPSVTTGIVSALGRSIQSPTGHVLADLIQTDAAINPGNSGGPLLNARGQVVGVNTAILADAQNIGFALSIDSILDIVDDLEQGREVTSTRPLLGIETIDVAYVDATALDRFNVQTSTGAFIQTVQPQSGAASAGLQPGDVIVEVDNRRIRSSSDVGESVRAREIGDQIEIVFERAGEEKRAWATLGSS